MCLRMLIYKIKKQPMKLQASLAVFLLIKPFPRGVDYL